MTDIIIPTPVRDLKVGDYVDLEGDQYAAEDDDVWCFLFAEVAGIEVETPECIRVDFDGYSYGFPTDHIVNVHKMAAELRSEA